MPPRKRAAGSDPDSDTGFVADIAPRSKKSKPSSSKAANDGKDGESKKGDGKGGGGGGVVVGVDGGLDAKKGKVDGEEFWGISDKGRRVTISSFKGKTMVNIREYYEQNGKVLPGKKGISLTVEQFSSLITVLPEIETALKEKGVEVPRPVYEDLGEGAEGEEAQVEEKEGAEAVSEDEDVGGKKNFEETSEEGE